MANEIIAIAQVKGIVTGKEIIPANPDLKWTKTTLHIEVSQFTQTGAVICKVQETENLNSDYEVGHEFDEILEFEKWTSKNGAGMNVKFFKGNLKTAKLTFESDKKLKVA